MIKPFLRLSDFLTGDYKELRTNEIAETTLTNFLIYCRRNLPFYNKRMFFISKKDIVRWLESNSFSHSTIAHNNALYYAFEIAIKKKYVYSNPLEKLKSKSSKRAGKVFSKEELNKIIEYTKVNNNKLYRCILLAAFGGLRRGEICGLKWEYIDVNSGVITIDGQIVRIQGKQPLYTKKLKTDDAYRKVQLPKFVINELLRYRDDSDFAVQGFKYVYLDPWWITRSFRELLEKLELSQKRFHDLRHTNISILFEEGVNQKLISQRVGHANVSKTLNVYTHLLKNENGEAVVALENFMRD